MLSNKPSKQSNNSQEIPDVALTDFLKLNQKSFDELVTFIDFAPENKLTIGFVEVNFAKERDFLIKTLQEDPDCQEIQFERFSFPEQKLRFLRDILIEELEKITVEPDKKLVLLITELENSIGMTGEYPPMLQDLNFIRDAFTTSVPYPMLFFLPDYALTRLAKYAPDFWAWRRGVFHFQTSPIMKAEALNKSLESERILGSLERLEKQERIDLLQRLLMEYCPSGQPELLENLPTRIQIHIQLGSAYRSQGDIAKAREHLEKAVTLADDSEGVTALKASALHALGYLKHNMGEVEEAIAFYNQSLELEDRIGNVQGKAATLHQLAGIYAQQGEVEEAISL
ncbi:MAG: tetratricopeptide repeat protein, partial [Halothece sp.]